MRLHASHLALENVAPTSCTRRLRGQAQQLHDVNRPHGGCRGWFEQQTEEAIVSRRRVDGGRLELDNDVSVHLPVRAAQSNTAVKETRQGGPHKGLCCAG